uniref:Uncharacterized protein n=1 Tax=Eutreptiella gymnastica TaxID=73025 RepID=A0A7S4LH28_9EUGL
MGAAGRRLAAAVYPLLWEEKLGSPHSWRLLRRTLQKRGASAVDGSEAECVDGSEADPVCVDGSEADPGCDTPTGSPGPDPDHGPTQTADPVIAPSAAAVASPDPQSAAGMGTST